ncbi:hypothetical protein ACUY3K_05030 [Corynebacterium uberis]|uniref:hypothetical protein n=1 Tax=Corynebacterium uberis TaxID=2883169 RepID=UPI001D09BE5F|nr:hypothetical protein [Corynebacterium uberis]UDL73735.1 hypothetical protein LH391_00385 [Corynebacterium uberis]UDL82010.1 hypothetical protein LH395_09010 [Corynebacterium uberis]
MMTRKAKRIIALTIGIISTPVIIAASVWFGLSGIEYGIVYPIGVISTFLGTLVLFWTAVLPEIAFSLLKKDGPEEGQTVHYRGYGYVSVSFILFSGGLMMIGFIREAQAKHESKLGGYVVICICDFAVAVWFAWYCTFKSGWATRMSYNNATMIYRHGEIDYEMVKLNYILDYRDDWMPNVRIGGVWKPIHGAGNEGQSAKARNCRYREHYFPHWT